MNSEAQSTSAAAPRSFLFPAGVEPIYRDHRAPLLRFVQNTAWPRQIGEAKLDAEGVVQDVFVALAKRWADVREPERWIYKVAANKVRRRAKGEWHRYQELKRRLGPKPSSTDPVFVKALYDEVIDDILQLPTNQRIATYLFHVAGWSGLEIAELLDITANTVYVHVSRGVLKLKTDDVPVNETLPSYTMEIIDAHGVQIGDSNTQANTFALAVDKVSASIWPWLANPRRALWAAVTVLGLSLAAVVAVVVWLGFTVGLLGLLGVVVGGLLVAGLVWGSRRIASRRRRARTPINDLLIRRKRGRA
ncbi:hypothetical protein GCM10029964_091000 [Kibdelosporangium lantanae]